ncbi:helix-turn-helix domain-containing protein [Erythrobacter sp. BLCC-B19]|uniref:helix-turn-helix domain-containing protein n=1 Tax=Erythrobacter sp. BLCC-B19 TaxID=3025315 RepID=UPI002360DE95|nr:helix-turn-helix domain-containing protein [Erythrobacter sp. BLCC-B19]WDA42465.1 helix-turn-helix domain-containing protein [Erythrobacter sp. BLCC-B19]
MDAPSTSSDLTRDPPGDDAALTAARLIAVDYIAPPEAIAPFVTTLYHFRCDELQIRDIQPAAIGNLCLFPYGTGEMHFAQGHRDPNHPIGLLTPLSRATPIVVAGPFHAFGAALSPVGWAALTGLHAGQHRDRLLPAAQVLGPEIEELGARLIAAYRQNTMSGRECALALGDFIGRNVKPINPRHLELMAATARWLGASFNPEVGELAGVAGYSARQVQRLVERYFGLPPRALARKYRALRAAALLSAPALSLEDEAEISEAFFDQPHMIREITHFVGRTPARLGDPSTPYLAEMIDARNLRELEP